MKGFFSMEDLNGDINEFDAEETGSTEVTDTGSVNEPGIVTAGTEETAENNKTAEAADTVETAETAETDGGKKKKKKRMKYYDYPLDQDIRYRGILSYRHLKILAWAIIVLTQVVIILNIGTLVDSKLEAKAELFESYSLQFSDLIVPLILFANFAIILDKKDTYKRMIIRYLVLFAALVVFLDFVYYHYLLNLIEAFVGKESMGAVRNFISAEIGARGYLSFNIFADLLFCTMFMFFVNYQPEKHFQGKKIIIFRLFALFPIIYELASILLKIFIYEGKLNLGIWVYPMMTTKPPVMLLVFVIMVLYIKKRERTYIKKGHHTHEEYQQFLKTNRNSFQFSRFSSFVFIFAAVVDFMLMGIMLVFVIAKMYGQDFETMNVDEVFPVAMETVSDWGFGASVVLISMIPIMLLFSYTKTYKSMKYEFLIPLIGIITIIVVYIEGIYRILMRLPAYLEKALGPILEGL